MKRLLFTTTMVGLAGLYVCIALLTNCARNQPSPSLLDATSTASTVICGDFTFGNQIPSTNFDIGSQDGADCFAWAEFVALNWPSNPSLPFGEPDDYSLVQWQTYMPADLIFQPWAQVPPPWGTTLIARDGMDAKKIASGNYIVLSGTSKIPGDFEENEATTNSGPAWLGAQNGTNIWYEIRVNEDEYNYIINNQYYDANVQQTAAQNGTPIMLPDNPTGAMEIKAAWMEVPDLTKINSERFKLSNAYVQDESGGSYRETVVALIGLHILRKTVNQPTFVWATFEQIDNLPQAGAMAPYNLFNPNCLPETLQVKTAYDSDTTVIVNCIPNVQPPYFLVHGNQPTPIQVSRKLAFDRTSQTINPAVQTQIQKQNSNSVWQYYQLIDVIWSTNPTPDTAQPTTIPLTVNSMNPPFVSNVALETYNQQTSCINSCHKYASVAPGQGSSLSNATDFSFLFGNASFPIVMKK
jgi:hypothetical protein